MGNRVQVNLSFNRDTEVTDASDYYVESFNHSFNYDPAVDESTVILEKIELMLWALGFEPGTRLKLVTGETDTTNVTSLR